MWPRAGLAGKRGDGLRVGAYRSPTGAAAQRCPQPGSSRHSSSDIYLQLSWGRDPGEQRGHRARLPVPAASPRPPPVPRLCLSTRPPAMPDIGSEGAPQPHSQHSRLRAEAASPGLTRPPRTATSSPSPHGCRGEPSLPGPEAPTTKRQPRQTPDANPPTRPPRSPLTTGRGGQRATRPSARGFPLPPHPPRLM